MSDSAEAWVEMLADLPAIRTDEKADVPTKSGGHYTYKYASLPAILEVIRPILMKHGFAVTQNVTSVGGNVAVTTLFDHVSGDQRQYGPLEMPASGGAQAVGSAITYARRYGLVAALGLAPDDDDDGAAASQPRKPRSEPEVKLPRDEAWEHTYHVCGDDMAKASEMFKTALDALGDRNVDTPQARDSVIALVDRMLKESASDAPE